MVYKSDSSQQAILRQNNGITSAIIKVISSIFCWGKNKFSPEPTECRTMIIVFKKPIYTKGCQIVAFFRINKYPERFGCLLEYNPESFLTGRLSVWKPDIWNQHLSSTLETIISMLPYSCENKHIKLNQIFVLFLNFKRLPYYILCSSQIIFWCWVL